MMPKDERSGATRSASWPTFVALAQRGNEQTHTPIYNTERPFYVWMVYNRQYTLQNLHTFCSLEEVKQVNLRSGKLTCELYGS